MNFENSLAFAQYLDEQDILKHFHEEFFIPQFKGKDCIYFTGNSLGLQPKSVKKYIEQELHDWAKLAVDAHLHAKSPWINYHELFPNLLSKIVGALPQEIVVMNQLTVNLHLLMVSFYQPTKQRYKIICEQKAFSSDQYAIESQVKFHGLNPENAIIEISPREGEYTIRTEDILTIIQQHNNTVALVLFGGVNYYSGQAFDMKKISQVAHNVGAYAAFDLAHAAGNIELHLHEWNVDFAVWCSYKYLNSGPGAVGGAFIHQKHIVNPALLRFAGWWGYKKETRFQMQKGFEPIPTAEGWQLSNAPVLSMAAHKAALDIFEEAGMQNVIQKGKLLSNYLYFILDEINSNSSKKIIEIITPKNDYERGCQISMLMLESGKEIFQMLKQNNVVADWREPNVIRIAPVPLYNSFEEVWNFANIIETILKN